MAVATLAAPSAGLRSASPVPSALVQGIGKKELKQTISWTLNNFGVERTTKFMDDLKVLGFAWATRAGVSIGLEDLSVPDDKAPLCEGTSRRTLDAEARYENGDITVVEKFLKVTDEWTKASEQVKDAAFGNFRDNDPTNPVYMMANSGARGNVSQVRQLVAMRGLMADANGDLIDVPIKNCLTEGMTVTDMLISGHGARKGVIDTALRTADAGYLYRRLDFAATGQVVRGTDCGTPESLRLTLRGLGREPAPLQDRLRGRVLARPVCDPVTQEVLFDRGHLVTLLEAQQLQKRWRQCKDEGVKDLPPIHVRSPLTCKLDDGICACCYGEDLSTPGQLARLGLPVGTIAAQSMGEPGTQLTMRTFHTGGAFEGTGGKGIQAKHGGRVRVRTSTGAPVARHAGADGSEVGTWRRTKHGDVACLLGGQAVLEVTHAGKVLQREELASGFCVWVQDGEEVTRGQVLFEQPAKSPPAGEAGGEDVEEIAKPILSDESGEVVVAPAPVEAGCLPDGSQLVWVLQGTCLSVPALGGCTVGVRHGDVVAPGVPLATDWAATRQTGVPRFEPRAPAAAGPAAGGAPAAGWRLLAWPEAAAEEEEVGAGTSAAGGADALGHAGADDAFSLRTDFDGFALPAGRVTEYRAAYDLPAALRDLRSGSEPAAPPKAVISRGKPKAPTPPPPPAAPLPLPPVAVLAHTGVGIAAVDDQAQGAGPSVTVACDPPSGGVAGVLCPVARTAHPEHIVPMGGLVIEVPAGHPSGLPGRAVAWSAEEVHKVRVQAGGKDSELLALVRQHGNRRDFQVEKTQPLLPDSEKVLMRPGVEGSLCVYKPCAGPSAPVVVEEPNGVLRRECWDRACWSDAAAASAAQPAADVELVMKPGLKLAVPTQNEEGRVIFDETWYAPVAGQEDCAHFHQKLVPPDTDFSPAVPGWRCKSQWCVVELLDDPRGLEVCRVLIRPARVAAVPADAPPGPPSEGGAAKVWHLPFASGEVVASQGATAIAHEVTLSVARHVSEPHSTTTVAVPAVSHPGASEEAAAVAVPQPQALAPPPPGDGAMLRVERQLSPGELHVVQHAPARRLRPRRPPAPTAEEEEEEEDEDEEEEDEDGGDPAAEGDGEAAGSVAASAPSGAWREPPPRHLALAPGAKQAAPLPRRQLPSTSAGFVCRAGAASPGSASGEVAVVGEEDCIRVPCHGRPSVLVGALVRRGEALSPQDTAPSAGQVLIVEKDRSAGGAGGYVVVLRRARAYLVTSKGQVFVKTGSIVNKGDLLGTEALVAPRTSDIVQGLPRIEKLFEASNGALQERLDTLWDAALRRGLSNLDAAKAARDTIQEEIVGDVQSAYLEQGVSINSRHMEVVVRRMTQKCEVLTAIGGATMAPGSLADYREIEALMALQPTGEVRVRPLVRGVTRLGLDSHVMVAMGFREVDNVLTQEVMRGPSVHHMEGIKENLMVGKRVSVGTNCAPAGGLWAEATKQDGRDRRAKHVPERGPAVDVASLFS